MGTTSGSRGARETTFVLSHQIKNIATLAVVCAPTYAHTHTHTHITTYPPLLLTLLHMLLLQFYTLKDVPPLFLSSSYQQHLNKIKGWLVKLLVILEATQAPERSLTPTNQTLHC